MLDVNETLLDVAALDGFFAEVAGDAAARREWFDLLVHHALALTAACAYRPFGEIAAACLVPVVAARGRTATFNHQKELGERLRRLPAHPEVAGAIGRLRAAGFDVVTLTNSVTAVAEDQLRESGLRPLVDTVYSADQVGCLKPAPDPYRFVLADRGVAPEAAVLVAAHGWDLVGAAEVGMATAFISRDGRVPLPAADPPTLVAGDLADAADQLVDRYAGSL